MGYGEITIGGRVVSDAAPPFIIAEVSGNHNGEISRAKKLIEIAKDCGADAVKLQTYTPDTMTIKSDKPFFKINGGLWDGYTLYDLYNWAHTPWEWHKELFEHARQVGILCFSTPFDESAVEFLEQFNPPAYKIASFELTDIPLIRYVARKKRPMIMSTGMASLEEINEAVEVCHDEGNFDLVLLHCVSGYPTPVGESNIRTIPVLRDLGQHIVGLSDHTISNSVAVASVALGACVIEKHFTTMRSEGGPDAAFSLEPDELKQLVAMTREAFEGLGKPGFARKDSEKENIKFRRSLFFVKDVQSGEKVKSDHIRRIRPGYGAPPRLFEDVVGRVLKCSVSAGTPVDYTLFE